MSSAIAHLINAHNLVKGETSDTFKKTIDKRSYSHVLGMKENFAAVSAEVEEYKHPTLMSPKECA